MRPPEPEDWFDAEQPLATGLVAELQRLKRRARARWLPVLLVAITLTTGVIYKRSQKQKVKRAQVVLAVTEGLMGDGVVPMPVIELRDYVASVLLSNEALAELVWREDLFTKAEPGVDPRNPDMEADLTRRLAVLAPLGAQVSEVSCKFGRCKLTFMASLLTGLQPALAKLGETAVLDDYADGMVQGRIVRVANDQVQAVCYLQFGDALMDLRDMFSINVFRNYFLYEYDADAPRSARIAVVVSDPHTEAAWQLAHKLAMRIKDREVERRLELGEALAADAGRALATVRATADELENRVSRERLELGRAEEAGLTGKAAALRVELEELKAKRRRAEDNIVSLAGLASGDEQAAAIDRAGLGMTFEIVAEKRSPDEAGVRLYFRAIQAALLFFILLPLIAIIVGTFDPRVHDREDVERVGLPVLGHLPAFPGDRVGSLRARGVRGRRVPS